MVKRPRIKPGDIVKFSKKGKRAEYPWPEDITMIVSEVIGFDSTDSNTLVKCKAYIDGKRTIVTAYRHHLWFTGKNIDEVKSSVRVMNSPKK